LMKAQHAGNEAHDARGGGGEEVAGEVGQSQNNEQEMKSLWHPVSSSECGVVTMRVSE